MHAAQPDIHVSGQMHQDIDERWPAAKSRWDPAKALKECLENGFIPGQRLHGGRFCVALSGTWHHRPVVARLDPNPDLDVILDACEGLYEAGAAPQTLYANPHTGVQIIERIQPGHDGKARQPNVHELAAALHTLAGLRQPEVEGHIGLRDFLRARIVDTNCADVAKSSRPPTHQQRTQALRMLDDLCEDSQVNRIIHGDCSAGNILYGGHRWWLIDPRGITGDWNYDVAVATWKYGYGARAAEELIDACGADAERVRAWEHIARTSRI